MSIDAQAVIQAIIRAVEERPPGTPRPRRPVISISRTIGSGGDEIARAVADRLGIDLYGAEILDAIARGANVSKTLVQSLNEKLDATDAWVYSAVFGKHVSRDEYVRFLITVVRGLYHAGGVILGRGAHVILAGRPHMLRVRIVGSVEACAGRIAEQDGTSFIEAKRKVVESNKRRGRFVWNLFESRYNEPTNFDLVINTDNFRNTEEVVDLIMVAVRALRLDHQPPQPNKVSQAS